MEAKSKYYRMMRICCKGGQGSYRTVEPSSKQAQGLYNSQVLTNKYQMLQAFDY